MARQCRAAAGRAARHGRENRGPGARGAGAGHGHKVGEPQRPDVEAKRVERYGGRGPVSPQAQHVQGRDGAMVDVAGAHAAGVRQPASDREHCGLLSPERHRLEARAAVPPGSRLLHRQGVPGRGAGQHFAQRARVRDRPRAVRVPIHRDEHRQREPRLPHGHVPPRTGQTLAGVSAPRQHQRAGLRRRRLPVLPLAQHREHAPPPQARRNARGAKRGAGAEE
mmetsp:Transcript_49429/g.116826  ORF Transcript_49429/g.116826 Transcript_49429/m.116826 type:complete len:223 (+) Transcript_49429:114-782(+)